LVSTSLKDSWSIFKNPWALPEKLNWVNFYNAWVKAELGYKFLNSAIVDIIALFLILFISAKAAYVLARFDFPGNRLIFYLFISGMALPVFMVVVPLFILMQNLSLLNTRTGLVIVYVAYSLSFTIFVLRGFFRTIPRELSEAALIDGCSPFGVYFRIMLPLVKPGLVTAGIFVFIGLWNEYPLALILISSDSLHTLPLGIANLAMTLKYQADWGALFAGLTIVVIPTVILYSVFQKKIQAGLTAGAIKG
ncbi:carbohydrate ABC transporter permease, partial [Candidatus Sumerlaeota bacterium]|nr:carbohydrate ABC transporter permease [Candidatus Sumerlaeota bacterium]